MCLISFDCGRIPDEISPLTVMAVGIAFMVVLAAIEKYQRYLMAASPYKFPDIELYTNANWVAPLGNPVLF